MTCQQLSCLSLLILPQHLSQVSELSVSLTASASTNKRCAFPSILEILSYVPAQVENSEPQCAGWGRLPFTKHFSRTLEAVPCDFSPSFKPYRFSVLPTEMLNLCSAFKTPTLSSSHCAKDPSEPCSREQFILTSFRIKPVSTCFQLKFAFLPLYLPRWEQKPSKSPIVPLSFCHIQQSMEEFSSGKARDGKNCTPNLSCKYVQDLGCLLT